MNEQYTLLLIEDNLRILKANTWALSKVGYHIITATSLQEARERLKEQPIDLIVLDILLPDGNGLSLIREIRHSSTAPILLLTSLTQKQDILQGLRAGGDDYITKPYDVEELRERIAAFLRHDLLYKRQPQQQFNRGPLQLDLISLQAFLHGQNMLLSPKEFALLLFLLKKENQVLSAEELYQNIWQQPLAGNLGALKIALSRLRKKLENSPFRISAVRGEGYRFEEADG